MFFPTKNLHKIFSFLNFRSSFRFTSKLSPQEKLSNLIDEFIADIKKQDINTPTFKEEDEKMKEIQIDYLKSTIKEEQDPQQRIKSFERKMKKKVEEFGNFADDPNEKPEENSELETESLEKKPEEQQKTSENLNFSEETSKKEGNKEPKPKPNNENLFETSNIGLNYIPKNLIIKTLVFPKNGAEVVLLGVEKRNEEHASFMLDLLSKLKLDTVITQIAPDQPFFIKTEDEYKTSWQKFIKGDFDYKFVINPNPTNLQDILLDVNRLKFLMDGSFIKSSDEFEMGSTFFYSKRYLTLKFEVDCFLTPFLYVYNNAEKMIPVIVNDFPILLYREYVARRIKLADLLDIYYNYAEETRKGNYNFDATLLKPEIFIKPKIDYLTEIIKQSCCIGKKALAIVDMNCAEFIAEEWGNIAMNSQLENLGNFLINSKKNSELDPNLSFSDYIHKHVLLDLIFDNFLQENFVKFKSFPFSCENTVGKDMSFAHIFTIWNFFQRKYKKSSSKIKTLDDLKNKVKTSAAEFEDTEHYQKVAKEINRKYKKKLNKNI